MTLHSNNVTDLLAFRTLNLSINPKETRAYGKSKGEISEKYDEHENMTNGNIKRHYPIVIKIKPSDIT